MKLKIVSHWRNTVIINTRIPLVHFIIIIIIIYLFFFEGGGCWVVGVGAIRVWALINFFYLQGGRLFEVGAYSRLGA